MDQWHVMIQLSNDLDYSHIFSRRVYYIQGCQMRLLKWNPNFDVRKVPSLVDPYRRNLYLVHLWGSLLWKWTFKRNIQRKSGLDRGLMGISKKVNFENLPIFCNHYKMHGHCNLECFISHPHLLNHKEMSKESKGKNILVNQLSHENTNQVQEMLVARNPPQENNANHMHSMVNGDNKHDIPKDLGFGGDDSNIEAYNSSSI
ncbi:hypothetical protein IEQ34_001640 [Dendrobium chrysotoxum]|uniref:DUF4283 domain-containing protein n=1 Tax=Dendrobium chrysotoxum TaxID=161865 RepID=A0AAV7HMG0_DENCH|nr:hypothetical protein IEQ34_001640 [Dendrobium chrysotoxum]